MNGREGSRRGMAGIGTCPFDRSRITSRKIQKVPRIVKEILGGLTIRCQYSTNGCETACSLDHIEDHEKSCDYRNEVVMLCECGIYVKREDINRHNCVRVLKQQVETQSQRIVALQKLLDKMKAKQDNSAERASPPESSGPTAAPKAPKRKKHN